MADRYVDPLLNFCRLDCKESDIDIKQFSLILDITMDKLYRPIKIKQKNSKRGHEILFSVDGEHHIIWLYIVQSVATIKRLLQPNTIPNQLSSGLFWNDTGIWILDADTVVTIGIYGPYRNTPPQKPPDLETKKKTKKNRLNSDEPSRNIKRKTKENRPHSDESSQNITRTTQTSIQDYWWQCFAMMTVIHEDNTKTNEKKDNEEDIRRAITVHINSAIGDGDALPNLQRINIQIWRKKNADPINSLIIGDTDYSSKINLANKNHIESEHTQNPSFPSLIPLPPLDTSTISPSVNSHDIPAPNPYQTHDFLQPFDNALSPNQFQTLLDNLLLPNPVTSDSNLQFPDILDQSSMNSSPSSFNASPTIVSDNNIKHDIIKDTPPMSSIPTLGLPQTTTLDSSLLQNINYHMTPTNIINNINYETISNQTILPSIQYQIMSTQNQIIQTLQRQTDITMELLQHLYQHNDIRVVIDKFIQQKEMQISGTNNINNQAINILRPTPDINNNQNHDMNYNYIPAHNCTFKVEDIRFRPY